MEGGSRGYGGWGALDRRLVLGPSTSRELRLSKRMSRVLFVVVTAERVACISNLTSTRSGHLHRFPCPFHTGAASISRQSSTVTAMYGPHTTAYGTHTTASHVYQERRSITGPDSSTLGNLYSCLFACAVLSVRLRVHLRCVSLASLRKRRQDYSSSGRLGLLVLVVVVDIVVPAVGWSC
jgi:hypothetical protein